ncbi:hypothetical protein ACEWY4_026201 [Coilia grayii]|uniref:Uncharacterized protein n=1 Tax=Coilia grayii TaxID=363190 RepID=A0ABD1IX59_9TELE
MVISLSRIHLSTESSQQAAMEPVTELVMAGCTYQYRNRRGTEGRGYVDRLSFLTGDLQRGDVSLRLSHVTCSDSDSGPSHSWTLQRRRDEKLPLRRVASADVTMVPNMMGQRTNETPPPRVQVSPQVEASPEGREGEQPGREAAEDTGRKTEEYCG